MQTTRGEATVREAIVIWVEKAMRAPEQPAFPLPHGLRLRMAGLRFPRPDCIADPKPADDSLPDSGRCGNQPRSTGSLEVTRGAAGFTILPHASPLRRVFFSAWQNPRRQPVQPDAPAPLGERHSNCEEL